MSIGAYAYPISQPSDRHRRAETEPRRPSLEVMWLILSPAMSIQGLRVHHVIGWAYAPMLIKFTVVCNMIKPFLFLVFSLTGK
jgi:hypothetical protein